MNKEADNALIDLTNLKIILNLLIVIQVDQFHPITAIMEIQVLKDFRIQNKQMSYLVDRIQYQIRTQNGKLH